MDIRPIARIENDLKEKFGVPRQSGLADIRSRIVFEPEYRVKEAFRGLEGYSHIWLLWVFSEAGMEKWSPTVRPPRLGGNIRMGVFATRSPFRPNSIGLSSVELEKVETDAADGPVLYVRGADLMDGTPIIDIKPYLAYTDSHPGASGGFALTRKEGALTVDIPEGEEKKLSPERAEVLRQILAQDPRPQYREDGDRIYTMSYGESEVEFSVFDGRVTVRGIFLRGGK